MSELNKYAHPDISHHHPVTSWSSVDAKCDFLITKATEGTNFIDSTLKSFIKECEKRNIPYWLYTFLRPGNELAQTKYMVKVCKPLVGKNFVGYVLDIEKGNKQSNCIEALNWLKKQGKPTMIYTMWAQYSSYTKLIKNRGDTLWWEARYGLNNGKDTSAKYPCHAGVDLHQYTSNGHLSGITGDIDLNKVTGHCSLDKFLGKTKAAAPKKTGSKTKAAVKKVASAVKKAVTSGKKGYTGTFPVLPPRGFYEKGNGITTLKDYPTQIKRLQKFLIWGGFLKGSADGKFGPATETAVKAFQKKTKLAQDGLFGKDCLAKAKAYKK